MAQDEEEFASEDEPDIEDADLEDDGITVELDDDLEAADDDATELEIDDDLDEGATVVETEEAVEDDAADDATATKDDEEDVVLELDEELHPDDVEEPLDVLLKERTAAATLEDDEDDVEEEEVETDERGEGPARIVPRRPGEFLCTSCFLVLPRNQLADEKNMLCRDCA
jgi:hypothetical protein